MNTIQPSRKALNAVRSAHKALGKDATILNLCSVTGYDRMVVLSCLKILDKAPKRKPKEVQEHYAKPEIPVFVQEIQKNTGLEALKLAKIGVMEEWILIAPTGLPLLRLIGKGDLLQIARPIRDASKVYQGLTHSEIENRRQRRARKK